MGILRNRIILDSKCLLTFYKGSHPLTLRARAVELKNDNVVFRIKDPEYLHMCADGAREVVMTSHCSDGRKYMVSVPQLIYSQRSLERVAIPLDTPVSFTDPKLDPRYPYAFQMAIRLSPIADWVTVPGRDISEMGLSFYYANPITTGSMIDVIVYNHYRKEQIPVHVMVRNTGVEENGIPYVGAMLKEKNSFMHTLIHDIQDDIVALMFESEAYNV